jgi:hypothetical protein
MIPPDYCGQPEYSKRTQSLWRGKLIRFKTQYFQARGRKEAERRGSLAEAKGDEEGHDVYRASRGTTNKKHEDKEPT